MSDVEKQTLKMKLVKTPNDTPISCSVCFFNVSNCAGGCGSGLFHFEPSIPIKIEIVEDKP